MNHIIMHSFNQIRGHVVGLMNLVPSPIYYTLSFCFQLAADPTEVTPLRTSFIPILFFSFLFYFVFATWAPGPLFGAPGPFLGVPGPQKGPRPLTQSGP